MLLYFEL